MNDRKPLRIVFMGTPEFAVPSLEALINNGFEVIAVVTAPDKPSGRGMKLQQSGIKKFAVEKNLPVLQPVKLKDPQFIRQLKDLHPDVQVVVAFRMLPEMVWNLPPLGTINLHASLLPQYRGAAPINWAIINGENETGLTTFKLQHEIDTGNILLQKKVAIEDNDNAGSLHDKLMKEGASLLVETMKRLEENELSAIEQSDLLTKNELKHAPRIHPEMCEINWNQTTEKIHNFIRGMSPYPGAYSFLKGKRIKILQSKMQHETPEIAPGDFLTDKKSYLKFATADGYLLILSIKPEGKREMAIEDFLRGWRD